jgi:hypothetical protein
MDAMRSVGFLSIAALLITALPAAAQTEPAAEPVKPYKTVMIALPQPVTDPTLDAPPRTESPGRSRASSRTSASCRKA